MEHFYFAVIPAKAGIQWLQELRDPRLSGDDGKLVFFDTPQRGEGTPCPTLTHPPTFHTFDCAAKKGS